MRRVKDGLDTPFEDVKMDLHHWKHGFYHIGVSTIEQATLITIPDPIEIRPTMTFQGFEITDQNTSMEVSMNFGIIYLAPYLSKYP